MTAQQAVVGAVAILDGEAVEITEILGNGMVVVVGENGEEPVKISKLK